nr:transposon protein, putative, CACTA, En/Spm sub-class [Ipomoea batatas]
MACPSCNLETSSRRLQNGRKTCYLGHRRFLPIKHSWRKNGKAFDGTKENRSAPKQLSGDDILAQYNEFSQADWWDVYHKTGFKVDKFGFPMVNITRKLQTDEPYVLASQAEQVYYVSDIKEPNWHVVVKTKPRDFYDLPDDVVEDEPCQENENFGFTIQGSNLEDDNNVTVLHRPDLDATTVEVSSSNINTMSIEEDETDSDGDAFINDDDEIPTTEDEEADDD